MCWALVRENIGISPLTQNQVKPQKNHKDIILNLHGENLLAISYYFVTIQHASLFLLNERFIILSSASV